MNIAPQAIFRLSVGLCSCGSSSSLFLDSISSSTTMRMMLQHALLIAITAITGAYSNPVEVHALAVPEASFYSSFWNDGKATVKYNNGANGLYSVNWSGNKGNFVAGKGWNTGGARYDRPEQPRVEHTELNILCILGR
jgi:hypothetical protein